MPSQKKKKKKNTESVLSTFTFLLKNRAKSKNLPSEPELTYQGFT